MCVCVWWGVVQINILVLQLVLLEINIDVAGVADSHEVKVKLSEFDEKDMKSLESARYN